MVTQAAFFGDGVGKDAGSDNLINPNQHRVFYVEPTFPGLNLVINSDQSRWAPGLKFYVVNNRGANTKISYAGGSPTLGSLTLADGEVGEYTLINPSATPNADNWIARAYAYNTSARTHGESTRSDTIANVIAANARATIAASNCDVWVFANCFDGTDLIYSRQDFSAYEGQAVNFSFEDSGLIRSVARASSITKPIDTRDLLSLIASVEVDGCYGPWDLLAADNTTSNTNHIKFLGRTDGVESGLEMSLASNTSAVADFYDKRGRGDYQLFATSTQAELFNTSTRTTVATVTPSTGDFSFVMNQNASNRYGAVSLSPSGHFYLAESNADIFPPSITLNLRRYTSSGSVAWTRTYASGGGNSFTRIYPTKEVGGYIAVAITGYAGGQTVEVLNASNGNLVSSCVITASTTNILLNVESGVPYIYGFLRTTFWAGGGGADLTNVKYRASDGTLMWSYDALGGGGSASLDTLLYNNALYINKGSPTNWHDNATATATILRLDLNGNLLNEWVSSITMGSIELMDIDTVTGDLLVGRELSHMPTAVLDGSTGAVRWEENVDLNSHFAANTDAWALQSSPYMRFLSSAK